MSVLNRLLLVCWATFWLFWLISAMWSKKNSSSARQSFVTTRMIVFLIALILLRTSFIRTQAHHINSYGLGHGSNFALIIGFIIFLLGLLFAIWARLSLGKNWGMPMSLKQDPELVTTGPYHFVRHPIYTGILLAVVGSAIVNSFYWLAILVFVGIYFIYSSFVEEKNMLYQFPKTYPAYKKRTKMLIPFVL